MIAVLSVTLFFDAQLIYVFTIFNNNFAKQDLALIGSLFYKTDGSTPLTNKAITRIY